MTTLLDQFPGLLDELMASGLDQQASSLRPARPLRVGIYCRISDDDEKEGKGVVRQTTDCRTLQADRYPLLDGEPVLYIDNDVTAMGKKKREAFERLLCDLQAGRLDVVIVWHTDRLYRRIEELSRIMAAWAINRPEIAAVTVGKVDFTTPTGRFLARVMAIVGQYEVEHLIERCLRKKRELREEGKVQGGDRPFGYAKGGYNLEPREAARMRIAARRLLVGHMTVADIARDWNARGVKTARGGQWTGLGVRRVLVRWRNVGIVEHEGQPAAAATWAPVFDEATFAALRKVLGDGSPKRRYKPHARHLLAGIARCGECGAKLHGAGEDPSGKLRYKCSASNHLKRVAPPIESHVEHVVVGILSRPDAIKLLGEGPSEDRIRELHIAAAVKEAKLREANEMYANDEIDRAQLRDITANARKDLADIEKKLSEMSAGSVLDGMVGPRAAMAWERLDLDRKRVIIDHLVTVTVQRAPRGGDGRSKDRAKRLATGVIVEPKGEI